jgi:hypothetical protein
VLRPSVQIESVLTAAAASLAKDLQALRVLAELVAWLQQCPCPELYCLPDIGRSHSLKGLGYVAVLLLAETYSHGTGPWREQLIKTLAHKGM